MNDPMNLENGVYDLETGELQQHTSDIYFTSQLTVAYDPDAECPVFKDFLEETLYEEDIETIQELFGYCLHKSYPIQKAFLFTGEGSNGKSTLLRVLQQILGDKNVANVGLQKLEENRFSVHNLFAL